MINNVSFGGKVYWAGKTYTLASNNKNERAAIARYADDYDLDIFVIDRDYYVDGKGRYSTFCVARDEDRTILARTFDFRHPERSKEKIVKFNSLI